MDARRNGVTDRAAALIAQTYASQLLVPAVPARSLRLLLLRRLLLRLPLRLGLPLRVHRLAAPNNHAHEASNASSDESQSC